MKGIQGLNRRPCYPADLIVADVLQMVAMSMADGYARVTNKPQCVIIHVDVGTSALAAAVHNASAGRAPVLIFAGLSPYTIEVKYLCVNNRLTFEPTDGISGRVYRNKD